MSYDWAKGSEGKANFGGTDICVTGWTFNEGGDDADTTHSCSSGVKTSLQINTEYTGTFDAVWDKDAQPDESPNVTRGQTGTLLLYVSTTAYISIAVEITSFEVTSVVSDVIKYKCTWKGTAAPTYP